ncbi:MAG TPA: GPP34 family phosphoprotein [Streptosporangiaceae bacterium]|nr:GPP34 family phosphoprotein [Streptosporangiaceae bacterium]
MARLSGTGLLADDLYLLAHHDVTGRAYLQPRATGLGLAGALLAELVLAGKIRFWPAGLVVTGGPLPQDELACAVLALLSSETRPARDWLLFLSRSAAREVAGRLERAGYLMRVGSRRPWRDERWVPMDPDCAFASVVRVRAALDQARTPTITSVTLAGLAAACGLSTRLAPYASGGALRALEQSVRRLPPDLREVVGQTQAALDGLLLAQRV